VPPEQLLELGLSKELVVLVVSALPVFELRGGIPVGMGLFQFPWYYAFLLSFIGNLIPVPILLLFFNTFYRLLGRIGVIRRYFDWVMERTRQQGKMVEKYERIGLALFVAIPLPVTGAWTGALAAVIFGIRFKYAFWAIVAGVFIAGVIVTCLSYFGLAIYGMWQA
jgi:uncharacterized membrane protein